MSVQFSCLTLSLQEIPVNIPIKLTWETRVHALHFVDDLGDKPISRSLGHQISRKRCVIRQKLLQSTNRKQYTSFRLRPPLVTLKYISRTFQSMLSFPRPVYQNYARYVHRISAIFGRISRRAVSKQ